MDIVEFVFIDKRYPNIIRHHIEYDPISSNPRPGERIDYSCKGISVLCFEAHSMENFLKILDEQ